MVGREVERNTRAASLANGGLGTAGAIDRMRWGMMARVRYRFVGRVGDRYVWESVLPIRGDSRHSQLSCSVQWFWSGNS